MSISNIPTSSILCTLFTLLSVIVINGCQENTEANNKLSDEEEQSVEIRPEVIFAIADDQPVRNVIESRGVVEANREVSIQTRISGYIKQTIIRDGRSVTEGEQLLKLKDEEWIYQLEKAKREKEKAEQEYRILGIGHQEGSAPDTNLWKVNTGLAQAEIDLKRAELDLSFSDLKAPFGGQISTSRNLAEGAYITAGTELGRLVDYATVRIRFNVLEAEINKIALQQPVTITSPGGDQTSGKVASISPVIDPQTKTGVVIVEADNRDKLLKPGMTVDGSIEISQNEGKARVPRNAILARDNRTLLFKLNGRIVEWVYVKPQAMNEEWAVITNPDIAPGDTVAVDKHFALSHLAGVEVKMR